jgi:hypothetical protein
LVSVLWPLVGVLLYIGLQRFYISGLVSGVVKC